MNSLSICSLNVHGIRNRTKRQTLFKKLKKNNFDIICLQETYILEADVEQWEREWGGKIIFCSGSSHSMGQVIMLRNKFPFKVDIIKSSQRILAVKVHTDDPFLLVNAYAPNPSAEKTIFLQSLTECVNHCKESQYLVMGDFNCVLDNNKDIISGNHHKQKDVDLFNTFLRETELSDVWRLQHEEEKAFTWYKKNPFIARRLDYIFASNDILNKCFNSQIHSIAQSDHSLVSINIALSQIKRGPSYWKFNDNLLQDKIFVDKMNAFLDKNSKDNKITDPQIKWDFFKVIIRDFCINYSIQKCKQIKENNRKYQIALDELDKMLVNKASEKLIAEKESLRRKVELYEIEQAKSAQVRSREKYIAEGEKNTRYFLSLEKARAGAKIMDRLKTGDGKILTNQSDILNEQHRFYSTMFSRKGYFDENKAEQFSKDLNIPQLSDEQRKELDEPLLEQEFSKALKEMKNGTAPGLDGLTTSFIKFFWIKLKLLIIPSLQAAYDKGEMSITQKRAVITLLHKGKELPRDDLSNWRPISLTNSDYKILAKCLASRLSSVMSDLVSEDQVGFIKGRKVSNIIRLIDDTIEHIDKNNSSGIILALDYSRAFDSISKEYMIWTFKKFGFGPNFINWIEVLTKNTESSINYMGWLSETFKCDCGIRQGCPLSPRIFVLALEILAIKIRGDELVKGIRLPNAYLGPFNLNKRLKLAMYADDITAFLSDKKDVNQLLLIVKQFTSVSNLAINESKTEGMWLGTEKNRTENIGTFRAKKELKILGIIFSNNRSASLIEENWTKRIDNIETIIYNWSKRNLDIAGKLCIVKSLLIAQLVYPMQALIAPEKTINRINSTLFRFLWKRKYSNNKAFEKIKRTVMCSNKEEGGLTMINMRDMQTSFLLSWVSRLSEQRNETWKVIPADQLNRGGCYMLCANSSIDPKNYIGLERISLSFWKQAFINWLENKQIISTKKVPFVEQYLWNNKQLKFKNKVLFIEKWAKSGINFIGDIWKDGDIRSMDEIKEVIGNSASLFFDYSAVTTAVRALKDALHEEPTHTQNTVNTVNFPMQTSPRHFRLLLVKNKTTTAKAVSFWRNKYGILIDKNYWLHAYKCTNEERLRLLQWKILHNIYPTNILLNKMGIKETNKCDFCDEVDFIEHFFCSCTKLNNFWKYVRKQIANYTGKDVNFNISDILLGYQVAYIKDNCIKHINHILLIAKLTISKFKYGKRIHLECIFDYEMKLRGYNCVSK